MKIFQFILLSIVSIVLHSQDTMMLELAEDELDWVKNEVRLIQSNLVLTERKSYLQELVDLVYVDTNAPEDAIAVLAAAGSLEGLEDKLGEYQVYSDQIVGFDISTDSLDEEVVTVMIESTDFMFVPDYAFVGEEVKVFDESRFWLIKKLKSYDDAYSDRVIGVFLKSEPRRKDFPTRLLECINYYDAITKDVPHEIDVEYTMEPIRVNLDTLTEVEKREVLNNALSTKVASFCGADQTSMNQEVLIYKLSAELREWGIFVRSLLNVISDNVSRASDDPRSSALREKHYFNMRKVGIDPWKLLLGSLLKYEGKNNRGIYVHRTWIPALIFDMEIEKYFEEVLSYVKDEELDYVNRYELLWLAAAFVRYSKDQEQYERLLEALFNSIKSFPAEIQQIICQRIFGREYSRC